MNAAADNLPTGIEHLVVRQEAAGYSPAYSKIIRWLRLALPLTALAIAAIVFSWSGPRQALLSRVNDTEIRKTIGKNELVSPRFENTDAQNRPYTLTSERAVQDTVDGNVIILEKPRGDMTLEDNHWVAMEAIEGAFEQNERKLLLRGNVRLFRDGGYQLETSELHIDIANNTAFSEKDVFGQGPEGTLEAKGLQGDNVKGTLIFTGPVKLILNTKNKKGSKGFLE